MAAWLYQPVMFESSRDFDCEGFDPDQCQYYKQPWHNWYVADLVFALPAVAFFMCGIGIFVLGHILTQILAWSRRPGPSTWRRVIAAIRYLSYRGFYVKAWGWNSAPVGVLLLGATGTVFFFCMDLIPAPYYWPGSDMVWGNSPPLGTRSGWLALACMPFVFATASKTNWITLVTGVTHEKLQIFHRWISYAFFILALMHTFPFIVWHIRNHDMVDQVNVSNIFEYWTGIVALIFQAWLTVASWGPFRRLGYEFFKAAHFFAVVVFMLIFFWHCGGTLTSWDYFVATAAVYIPCLTYPWLRTLFEYGLGQKAAITIEDNGFTRIAVPATFKWHPGQHCFLRFRGFGLHALSSHPFTICSLPSTSPTSPSEATFYIRHRTGLTAKLYNYALTHSNAQIPVLVDGPYGGIDNHKFFSSDRLVVIAGGSGAGWTMPFIEQFLRHVSRGREQKMTVDMESQDEEKQNSNTPLQGRGPKSLRVVLATREVATRTWFHTTLKSLLSQYDQVSNSGLDVEVHVTRSAASASPQISTSTRPSSASGQDKTDTKLDLASSATSSSSSLAEENQHRGRPDLPALIREEGSAAARTAAAGPSSVGVFVCGPLTMQDDVRNAVARENLRILLGRGRAENRSGGGGMYLHLEHFTWA